MCGPTAAGKSATAMALAERHPIRILSADSRQIYRGFDLGTGKPSPEERRRVVHRGIDLVEPVERYSAVRWAQAALGWIGEAEQATEMPVVVGGTGFYVRALAAPLFDGPALDPDRRRALERELAPLRLTELRRWCAWLDPARAHLGRAQLARAIEIAVLSGTRISDWHRRAARAPRVTPRYLIVDPGAVLDQWIVDRIHTMLESGWEAEVAELMTRVPDDAPAWNATGYRAVRDLVRGMTSRASAIERIRIDTRQYAKRQRTWLRHQLPPADVTVLDPTSRHAIAWAMDWWRSTGGA